MAVNDAGPVVAALVTPATQDVTHHEQVVDISRLPTGFPGRVDGELAWTGKQFANESEYVCRLGAAEIDELEAGLAHFKTLGLDGRQVRRDNFPLPRLGPRLESISDGLHHGRGFAVLRGLDPRKYCVEDLTMLQLGIQGYIGERQARQDKKGNMLVHIVADSSSQTFHTEESGDIISWLTRSTATAGGKCIIASACTVYNVLAASRPDIVRLLARSDWPFAVPKFKCRPVIFYHEGRLVMNFGRAPLVGSASHPRKPRLPRVTAAQMEALDAIEAIAQATQLEIRLQAGDMHFINNLAVLHRREAFVNGEQPRERRHLVRMRLRSDQRGWAIPEPLRQDWFDAFERQGDRFYHLEPMPDGYFPLRSNPN